MITRGYLRPASSSQLRSTGNRAPVLICGASPIGSAPLSLEAEYEEIKSILEKKGFYRVIVDNRTSVEGLATLLSTKKPSIFHFAGHGSESNIELEAELGEPFQLKGSSLQAMLRVISPPPGEEPSARRPLSCVVLNACGTWATAKRLAEEIPFVIGMKQPITDRSALSFAKAFYRCLAGGSAIPEAFEMAKAVLGAYEFPDASAPRLYEFGTNHTVFQDSSDVIVTEVISAETRISLLSIKEHQGYNLSDAGQIKARLREGSWVINSLLVSRSNVPTPSEPLQRHELGATPSFAWIMHELNRNRSVLLVSQSSSGQERRLPSLLIESTQTPTEAVRSSEDEDERTKVELEQVSRIQRLYEQCVEILASGSLSSSERSEKVTSYLSSYRDEEHLQNLLRRISRASKLTMSSLTAKLPGHGKGGRTVDLVERLEMQRDFKTFLAQNRPIFAIVGESGTGKSTFLLQLTHHLQDQDQLVLLYAATQVAAFRTLHEVIGRDLRVSSEKLESHLERLHSLLQVSDRYLVILIDGINEAKSLTPQALKNQIEDLGECLPPRIKLAFSCRKVFWESFLNAAHTTPNDLYFGSGPRLLGGFSPEELEIAFERYAQAFRLKGDLSGLSPDLRQSIRDPLMLRMLAEGYRGQRLPSFAPAVLIFHRYTEMLDRKLAANGLMDKLDLMLCLKAEEIESAEAPDDTFNLDLPPYRGEISRSSALRLEDEGILVSISRRVYRFAYDRFFEYLLGTKLRPRLAVSGGSAFADSLRLQVNLLYPKHFSFLQALKSELIRMHIEDEVGSFFYEPKLLQEMLNHEEPSLRNLSYDVTRELIFESQKDMLGILASMQLEQNKLTSLVLKVAGESSRSQPFMLDGLFSGHLSLIRRVAEVLSKPYHDDQTRTEIQEEIVRRIRHTREPGSEHFYALIYYTTVIFKRPGLDGRDPVDRTVEFWREAVRGVDKDLALTTLQKSLQHLFFEEFRYFFGVDAGDGGLTYIWKAFPPHLKKKARRMAWLVVEPKEEFPAKETEIVRFFLSSIRSWEFRHEPSRCERFSYKFEYRIAQWILLRQAKDDYWYFREVLQRFVDTGFWTLIDLAISNMKKAINLFFKSDRSKIEDSYEALKEWTNAFARDEEKYYYAVNAEDPYSTNQSPIASLAGHEAAYFCPSEGPIPSLEKLITLGAPRDVRLAVLACRFLFAEFPRKVMGTLSGCLGHDDKAAREWTYAIFHETYLAYPRLVEEFLSRRAVARADVDAIKHWSVPERTRVLQYSGEPVYQVLFLSSKIERRTAFYNWYEKLLYSESPEKFFRRFSKFCLEKFS